jgi:hypothetical protein
MSKRTDTPKPIDPALLPAALTGAEMPTAIRTYGDLLAALRSGDLASVPGADTERLRAALGVSG